MSILPQEHWDMLDNAIKHNTQRVKEFVQTRHAHKLAKFGAANNNEYVNKDRWVVNLSSRKLTSAETTVLRYGLNFAPAPREIPIPKIVASIESGIRDLPERTKNLYALLSQASLNTANHQQLATSSVNKSSP